ncbi:MAG: hypothetical protein MR018_02495 [Clostridiales bacterium]|nr:hypothetical protein [Clostridiales bacterium]
MKQAVARSAAFHHRKRALYHETNANPAAEKAKMAGTGDSRHFPHAGADYGRLRSADFDLPHRFRHSGHPENRADSLPLRQALGIDGV